MMTFSTRSTILEGGVIPRWVGAASFEERSVGSLRILASEGARVQELVILTYETETNPLSEGEARRRENLDELDSLAGALGVTTVSRRPVNPYSYGAAQRLFSEVLGVGTLLDVSCVTKVHSLAAASVLADTSRRITLAYTVPQNYPGVGRRRKGDGWRDIIVAPLARTARLFNENRGRGVILLGHEADRLIVGLAEIEPAGGSIVLAISESRPDLGELARRRNEKVVRQLSSMRTADWALIPVLRDDLARVVAIVMQNVSLASQYAEPAPVILFPYGPKPFIIAAAFELARCYRENSWFVYPIPRSYDANYSEGIGEVQWYTVGATAANPSLQRARHVLPYVARR